MIVVLKPRISRKEETAVLREIRRLGYRPHMIRGVERTVIGAIGDERTHQTLETLITWPQVESVMPVQKRYKLVSREAHPDDSIVMVRGVEVGGRRFQVMAGPCSVEDEKQLMRTAQAVKDAGATILRGGAFKPRTSPYEFQGLGEKGLKLLTKARREFDLPIITELLSEQHVDLVAEYADILQIGTRNAQNFQLLIAAAKTGKPVLLKRGLSMRIEEWLLAGEYVLSSGNPNLMFCERGIRTFETYTRNTLDLASVPIIKRESHCPIVIDPSQGSGRADLVAAMCKGAVAMGADALLIEVHPNPAEAWSDGAQQVTLDAFRSLMADLRPFIQAADRE
ncbi:MAG TPA: 3-deoxy-7-phosphoheptulonate synthase [Candidatus Paceibacterota bacterium]|nr:3-deoxy-7-phosphoheptulonate synthase [Verrucomicrobiota bacterium]HOX03401.1 3-deoxy-7-phosphoheptulonate synthase [Verrucomicrobiota bacterium]HRZ46828.1 3-deoxy-7-phosphoheptulonate synthase [Candidatus Paceibacterota bacterium]